MSVELELSLDSLARWVRATDCHAAHQAALLEQARDILAGDRPAAVQERLELAGKLELWRYRHLDQCAGELRGSPLPVGSPGSEDRSLVDALDLAANALAGRPGRAPRWPRAAIAGGQLDRPEIEQALDCLRREVPLEGLCRRAAELTAFHFTPPAADCPNFRVSENGTVPFTPAVEHKAPPRRRILLYAPLYLSSQCINYCVYCGFRYPQPIPRRHLSLDEAVAQSEILRQRGFFHLLLVSADFPSLTTTEYHAAIIRALRARGLCVAVEIAPQTTASYAALAEAGACGVTLYQETFNESLYALYHPRGSKTSYDWRREGPERAAEAGFARLGLGVLLGLAEPAEDLLALLRHAAYLQARFPDCTLALSLPRIREPPQGFEPPYPVDDELLVRMYCALRLAMPRAELVLSTREPAALRNRLATICITQLSAGSSTTPGGYSEGDAEPRAGGQFPVCDQRPPREVADWLRAAGLEPVWELPDTAPGEPEP
jgi:2-iminoacetate synthase